ncbi:MAG: hypothetical protein KGI48_02975 [Hyphomicrobiales bacterium]|nr:hypothetical protein [Hyphomicrobiales bacterium]
MSIQLVCNNEVVAIHDFGRPACPCCGSIMLVAEQATFHPSGRIRNVWVCDDCTHEFATSIRVCASLAA